jgi:phage terminase large subunit-like protein
MVRAETRSPLRDDRAGEGQVRTCPFYSSPDRADAMVWAMAELMRAARRGPSARFL